MTNVTLLAAVVVVVVVVKVVVVVVDRLVADVHVEMRLTRFFLQIHQSKKSCLHISIVQANDIFAWVSFSLNVCSTCNSNNNGGNSTSYNTCYNNSGNSSGGVGKDDSNFPVKLANLKKIEKKNILVMIYSR